MSAFEVAMGLRVRYEGYPSDDFTATSEAAAAAWVAMATARGLLVTDVRYPKDAYDGHIRPVARLHVTGEDSSAELIVTITNPQGHRHELSARRIEPRDSDYFAA